MKKQDDYETFLNAEEEKIKEDIRKVKLHIEHEKRKKKLERERYNILAQSKNIPTFDDELLAINRKKAIALCLLIGSIIISFAISCSSIELASGRSIAAAETQKSIDKLKTALNSKSEEINIKTYQLKSLTKSFNVLEENIEKRKRYFAKLKPRIVYKEKIVYKKKIVPKIVYKNKCRAYAKGRLFFGMSKKMVASRIGIPIDTDTGWCNHSAFSVNGYMRTLAYVEEAGVLYALKIKN